MSKFWIFWSAVMVAVTGLVLTVVSGEFKMTEQTRKLEIRTVMDFADASNAVLNAFQEELPTTPIWFWGMFPEDDFATSLTTAFLQNSPPEVAFDEVWLDGPWQGGLGESLVFGDSNTRVRNVYWRKNEELVFRELEAQLKQGRRVLLISSPVDVNSKYEQSPAWKTAGMGLRNFKSLSFSGFPRYRSQERKMKMPCVLSHSDKEGTGAYGCDILGFARMNYKQRFTPGSRVMMIEAVSDRDYLCLTEIEPDPAVANEPSGKAGPEVLDQ